MLAFVIIFPSIFVFVFNTVSCEIRYKITSFNCCFVIFTIYVSMQENRTMFRSEPEIELAPTTKRKGE